MTLSNLTPGMTARITGYEPGNRAYRAKLLALGLTRGTTIRMVNAAPLGDPVQLEVRGFNVSLRKAEAAVVKVAAV
jgi:ferrous iron transport protein A